ncbi:MAG: single-stranded DNA-binding protein [Rhabdochlamydiaceae bacterium]|nr:single-stranded DNA-binding protein [Candidatus Amphrikana amoebophyrae]
MNHIMVAGHLGSDPEVRFTSSGAKVTSFRIAGNVRRGGKEETIWWRVTVWGDQMDKMISYLKKGSPVIAYGELGKPEIYTDKQGHAQVSLNVTAQSLSFSPFGKSEKSGDNNNQQFGQAPARQQQQQQQSYGNNNDMNYSYYDQSKQGQGQEVGSNISDEEIPF